MKLKVKKIIEQLERVGLQVKYDGDDKINPHIEIYRNLNKKSIGEIIFDKKGNIHSLVFSKKQTNSCWIKI